jgi:hypothetical protein
LVLRMHPEQSTASHLRQLVHDGITLAVAALKDGEVVLRHHSVLQLHVIPVLQQHLPGHHRSRVARWPISAGCLGKCAPTP